MFVLLGANDQTLRRTVAAWVCSVVLLSQNTEHECLTLCFVLHFLKISCVDQDKLFQFRASVSHSDDNNYNVHEESSNIHTFTQ